MNHPVPLQTKLKSSFGIAVEILSNCRIKYIYELKIFNDRFETSWPAFQQGAHGVVLVLDSSKSDYAKSAERFSTLLSNKPPGLSHCLILLMGSGPSNLKLSKALSSGSIALFNCKKNTYI